MLPLVNDYKMKFNNIVTNIKAGVVQELLFQKNIYYSYTYKGKSENEM